MEATNKNGTDLGAMMADVFYNMAEQKGMRKCKRSNLCNKFFKGEWNLSGAHPHLAGAMFSAEPTAKDSIVLVDQVARRDDGGKVGDDTHLQQFGMAVIGGFGHFENEADKRDAVHFYLQTGLDYLQTVGIDKEKLIISVCAGGNYLGQNFDMDKDTYDILRSLGVNEKNIVKNKGRMNFMLSNGLDRYSGYNIEFYVEHKGKLIEIGSSNIYEYLNKIDHLHKTVNKGVGVGFGLERLEMIRRNKKSVQELPYYQNCKDRFQEALGYNNAQMGMIADNTAIIADSARLLTMVLNDGQTFLKDDQTSSKAKSALAGAASAHAFIDLDPEKSAEITKDELKKLFADPVYQVDISDLAFKTYEMALVHEWSKKLGKTTTHGMGNQGHNEFLKNVHKYAEEELQK